MIPRFKVAIVGAGPAGLSCAAHAAELRAPHVLLEASSRPAHTLYRYQKGKHVMAEPGVLPLRSALPFSAGKREDILAQWFADIRKHKINLRLNAAVVGLAGERGAFELTAADGRTYAAEQCSPSGRKAICAGWIFPETISLECSISSMIPKLMRTR